MNIFKFRSVSEYLQNYIRQLPKGGFGEMSRIAAALGVSNTLVSQVIGGHKHFTPEQIHSLIEHLGLHGLESDYLVALLHRERAGSRPTRDYWNEKMQAMREQSKELSNRVQTDREMSEAERSVFYSNPLYTSIRLFTSVGNNGKTLPEIAERFELSPSRAGTILQFLIETGLCKLQNGSYYMGIQKTHLESASPHLARHHASWRLRAIKETETLSTDELIYTATVSLAKKDFEHLREEMVQFIKLFLSRVHSSPAEEIACFNMDFFWIKK